MSETLKYYSQNAETFVSNTVSVDFSKTQDRFLELLQNGSKVLDFGCGSGRDAKYFIEKGYSVDACDGSPELCTLATEYVGIDVKQMLFSELSAVDEYDGIWACASILHLPEDELKDVLAKIHVALKQGGILYTSFKYGDFCGYRNGRYFHDFTQESFEKLLNEINAFSVVESWITSDVRKDRDEEKWLNLILQKN